MGKYVERLRFQLGVSARNASNLIREAGRFADPASFLDNCVIQSEKSGLRGDEAYERILEVIDFAAHYSRVNNELS